MKKDARLAAYLVRIGLAQPLAGDAAALAAVQAAHRRAITFENLDVMLHRPIAIDSDGVFAKLVTAGRGGYCFEHNRLLADMLRAMGMEVRLLLGRPMLGQSPSLLPLTHCLVLAKIGAQEWIADAGFGGSFCPPLPLVDGFETDSADGARHRLRRIAEAGALPGAWLLERRGPADATDGRTGQTDADGYTAQYAFDLAEVADADCAMGNYWSSNHPSARFTNAHVASLCLPDGFVSLVDRNFSLYRAGHPAKRREVDTCGEYGELLVTKLNLAMPARDLAALPLFAGDDRA